MPDLSPAQPRTVPLDTPNLSVIAALARLGVNRAHKTHSERLDRIQYLLVKMSAELGVPAQEMHVVLEGGLGTPADVIAQQYKLPVAEVEHALSHPYVLLLQRELAAAQAEGLADPMRRVEQVANEMLDVKLDLVRSAGTHPRLRNEIASDLLDRGGVRKPIKLDAAIYKHITIDVKIAAQLQAALRDLEVFPAPAPYEQHLLVAAAPAADERELAQRLEQPTELSGASPTTSAAGAPLVEEVAA